MDRERERDLTVALMASLEAGAAVAARFGGAMEVRHKGPDQPLTEADLEANHILRTALTGARPEYGWLSEETADAPDRLGRRRVWIVDPVDGTKSFISGEPEFAVSVGLAEDGLAMLGVVYNPATREVYWAVAGGGAWLGRAPEAGGGALGRAPGIQDVRPLEVRRGERHAMLASRSEIEAGEMEPFREEWQLLPLGSTAYKLARVAEGVGEAFVSRGPKSEWDVCAGGLIVTEAGGRATDLRGTPLRYNRRDPRVYGILATNGAVHAELLRRIEDLPVPARLAQPPRDPLHPGLDEEEGS